MPINEDKYAGSEENLREKSLRKKLFIIVFGTNTPAGKLFDIVLLILIVLSVIAVMLESVPPIKARFGEELRHMEWVMTFFFTIEYIIRIWIVEKPKKYIFSFFGVIDFLAILPTYLSLVLVGTQGLAIIRALRILRVFRILKLMRFVSEATILARALKASRHKITVFFLFLIILVFILGSIMYLIEGSQSGFHSIPQSIYWAIVTLTTVGYGDITPLTVAGKLIASVIMLLGYSIIAIPTGIVGAEIYKEVGGTSLASNQVHHLCPGCGLDTHDEDANFCKNCGAKLED